jgi:hypothetical protein
MSINQNFPEVSPSLLLDFANSRTLDPRITFTRSSIGTYVASNGLIKTAAADEPRFDHDPETGESLGLLIEESRTNIVTYSENLSQWDANNVTYHPSNVLSPDGVSYAYEMRENTANFYHAGYPDSISLDGSSYYTISAWLKKGPNYRTDINDGNFQLYCSRGTGSVAYLILNSDFDTIVSHSNTTARSLTQYPNGWVKVTYTFLSNAAGSVVAHFLLGSGGSYLGDGLSGVYIWGVQAEVGSFPTSYIPTSGSTLTRQPDNASITGTNFTDFYNSSEGTAFVKVLMPNNNGASGIPSYAFKLTSDSNRYYGFSRDNVGPYHYVNTSNLSTFTRASLASEYKSALAIKENDINSYVNGDQNLNSTNVTLFVPDILYLGNIAINNFNILNGHIKSFVYYPQRLTDSQLQNLTK